MPSKTKPLSPKELARFEAGLPQLPTCRYPTENVVHDHALTKLLFTESDFV